MMGRHISSFFFFLFFHFFFLRMILLFQILYIDIPELNMREFCIKETSETMNRFHLNHSIQSFLIKLNFHQNYKTSNDDDISMETLQKIIFARTEEILELCTKTIKSNSLISNDFKMILTGEGSKYSIITIKIKFLFQITFIF